jgi:hypothetical protein
MNYETLDRITAWLIAAAVLIALALSFSARAEASTIAAAPCLKPAAHHRGHKTIAAPVKSCAAPAPVLWAYEPLPEPIAIPAVLTRYQDEPLPAQPVAPPANTSQPYISPWSGFDAGSFAFAGAPGSYVTPSSPTKPIQNSYYSSSNSDTVFSTTNVSNVTVSDITVNNSTTIPKGKPRGGPHVAHEAPEIDGANSVVMLTWLAGSLLVIRGARKL